MIARAASRISPLDPSRRCRLRAVARCLNIVQYYEHCSRRCQWRPPDGRGSRKKSGDRVVQPVPPATLDPDPTLTASPRRSSRQRQPCGLGEASARVEPTWRKAGGPGQRRSNRPLRRTASFLWWPPWRQREQRARAAQTPVAGKHRPGWRFGPAAPSLGLDGPRPRQARRIATAPRIRRFSGSPHRSPAPSTRTRTRALRSQLGDVQRAPAVLF